MDSNRQPPMTPEAQQELVDMLMTVEENDDMPSLYEASFTESDAENIVLAPDFGARDSQIPIPPRTQQNNDVLSASSSQSAFSIPAPQSSSASPLPQRSNRRARVEDDDDVDRDRRHPSQRVGSHSDQPSTSNASPNSFFAPFFTSFPSALGLGTGLFNRMPAPNPSGNGGTPNMNSSNSNANPTPASTSSSQSQNQGGPQNAGTSANLRAPVQFLDYEFSIVMDGSRPPQPVQRAQQQAPASNDPNGQAQQGGHTHPVPPGPAGGEAPEAPPNISFNPPIPLGNLATLLGIPFPLPGGGFGFPQLPEEKEDPERARKLVDGLEEVPVGLVRRLERVGTGGGGMGEDETRGGDVGCAVCWDRLLPEDVEQGTPEESSKNQGGSERMVVDEDAGEGTKEEKSESKPSRIVSLPCAHVFHAECLMPWFSRPRHTTCPTCRFNIDPDNLTYVSARQRRREQRRAANDNGNQPSESTPGEVPPNLASATPATAPATGTAEQPPQPQEQGGDAIIDLGGGGFAGIIQMLNAQAQAQQQQQQRPAAAPANDAAPSAAQLQAQEPPLPVPTPAQRADTLFPAGFGFAATLPMMPIPFTAVPPWGNAEGVPMPMPWRMTPIQAGTGGRSRTNVNASNGAPHAHASDANSTPAPTNGSSSSNGPINPQPQPHQRPTIVADVLRISVDMVFDGRPRRRVNQNATNNSATPQPASASTDPSQEAIEEQTTDEDTDGDHEFEDEPPILSQEEFHEVVDQVMMRHHQNPALNNENGSALPANDQPAPQTQPAEPHPHLHHPQSAEPHPHLHHPHVFPLGGIHVAGTGRSLEEAFSQAFARLQNQMAQPRQEGQNHQPTDAGSAGANENAPPPSQQTQADPQGPGQGQPPWQFMPMPFMDFSIPMRPSQPEGPKRPWAPPPPPGPTLRQRIERREQEAGLRCHDVSCGLGPSDEDPLGDEVNDTLEKVQQLSVMGNVEDEKGARKPVCEHRFHSTCLVSAERVALRGAEAVANEAGRFDVSCSVCRAAGTVTKEQWDEGVLALQ